MMQPTNSDSGFPPCPHRPPCPGCPEYGLGGIADGASGTLAEVCRRAGIAASAVREGAAVGHRHRARLAVRGRATSPKVGIFQEGSHRIADIPRCVIHHPLVNDTAQALRAAIKRTKAAPYFEGAHKGLLRYVQIVVERPTGTAQVTLVANATETASIEPLAASLTEAMGPALGGLWWNGNPERTNVILGDSWSHLGGRELIEEEIGGARVFFHPGAFGQANLDLADEIVDLVQGWVPDRCRVVELHAGAGAFGLGLAARSASVTFNEIDRFSLASLRSGLEALSPEVRDRTRVCGGPAEDHLDLIGDADLVIADPPRKGLGEPLRRALQKSPPARLALVSCRLESFLRDAQALTEGAFVLRQLVPFALFPFSRHVEVVSLFEAR